MGKVGNLHFKNNSEKIESKDDLETENILS